MLTSLQSLSGHMISAKQRYSFERMNKCRTYELGGRLLECLECGARIIQYNPCNTRGCPICCEKSQMQWKIKTKKRVLPIRHYHLTFSIPEPYTKIWLCNKKEIVESLFKAVGAAILGMSETKGLLLGSILVFHSHGVGMSYKPHMHCVLSGGGLDSTGKYCELGSIPFHDLEEKVEEIFENNIKKRIGLEKEAETCFEKENNYSVYTRVHEDSGDAIIDYLSGTRNGVVVDIERELEVEGNDIIIKQTENGTIRITRLDKKVFLDRYLNHIPPEKTVMIRYYGLYSNRHKEDYKNINRQVKDKNKVEEEKPYIELCPICNTETRILFWFKHDQLHLIPELRDKIGPPEHGCIINIA